MDFDGDQSKGRTKFWVMLDEYRYTYQRFALDTCLGARIGTSSTNNQPNNILSAMTVLGIEKRQLLAFS